MFIHFDTKTMSVKVMCGPCEEYKPSDEIKAIHEQTLQLQQIVKKFQDETLYPKMREIEALIKVENDKFQPTVEHKKE
jgi:NAD-dependent dihydropyrimidine dehydrogenase PreA subunit